MRHLFAPLCLVALLFAAAPATTHADDLVERARAEQKELKAAIKRALKAYVFIGSGGSGVLISADGYILTNDHVAGSAPTARVRTRDGTVHIAKLIGTDPYGDISLLKIDVPEGTQFDFIAFGDSDKARVGDTAIAVGNPFAMSNTDERPTVTVGILSALNRPQIEKGLPDTVMTDAPINPGNSGGPLISIDGKLIGINGQIATRYDTRSNTGIGYAISINQIKRFMPILRAAKGGMVRHGWLKGMTFENKSPIPQVKAMGGLGALHILRFRDPIKYALSYEGSAIQDPGPTGKAAGLQAGDVITAVDGWETCSPLQALARMISYPADVEVTLTIKRGEAKQSVKVKLDPFIIRGRPDIGVRFVASTGAHLEFFDIKEGGQAAKAGIQEGDRLVAASGVTLAVARHEQLKFLQAQLGRFWAGFGRTGASVAILVKRGEAGAEKLLALEVPKGQANMPALGFNLRAPAEPPKPTAELKIGNLVPGGPAALAGARKGDVIKGFKVGDNTIELASRQDFDAALRRLQPGSKATLLVERAGQALELPLTVGLFREAR